MSQPPGRTRAGVRRLTDSTAATCATAFLLVGVLAALSTILWAAGGPPLPTFTDVTEQAGIHFKHSYGDLHLSNIVEGTGPGCAFFDYNNDGLLDIYLVTGKWRRDVNDNEGRSLRGKFTNALYRNNGDGTFTDVTKQAGVGDPEHYGIGVSVADYDDDGYRDLYVLNYHGNVLFHNNGDGTFTDVTAKAGLAEENSWSVNAAWFDYDGDGDLDVYVANYLEYDEGAFRDFYAPDGFPGPLSYAGQPDHLYRNNGDGTFTDVTKEAGLFRPDGRAMSAVAYDFNNDGRPDIYVANDAMPNYLFLNNGDGTFTEKAVEMGAAFGEGGQNASSMGPAVGDVDHNGFLDLFIPDMGYSCLLLNQGPAFIDATAPAGVAIVCGQYTGWGGALLDYDNDGWLDIFVANGDAHHEEYKEESALLRFDGKGRFVDVAGQSGDYFLQKYVCRGLAFGDYDNDGDLDLLVATVDDSPRLLRNDGGNQNHWLTVIPRLAATGLEAIGARVTVTVGPTKMVDEVAAIKGYLSSSDPRPHFGLGPATRADRVEIRWPGGKVATLADVAANQILIVTEPEAAGTSRTPVSTSAATAKREPSAASGRGATE
jgi:hypothetical protein